MTAPTPPEPALIAESTRLLEMFRDPRFQGGWARFRHAMKVNAGDWPEPVLAARMVAVATDVWSGSPAVGSYNSWEKALQTVFPDFFGLPLNDGQADG